MTIQEENSLLKQENEALKQLAKTQATDLLVVRDQVKTILVKFGFVDEKGNAQKPNKIKLMMRVKDLLMDSFDGEGNGFLDGLIKNLSPIYEKYKDVQ